jgi:hypothetical protein
MDDLPNLKIVIFYSYVSLPEGIYSNLQSNWLVKNTYLVVPQFVDPVAAFQEVFVDP